MIDLKCKVSVSQAWQRGFFGNKLRTWPTPMDVPNELRDAQGFSLRSLIPGGRFLHGMPWSEMAVKWTPEFYVCEPAPDQDRVIQGEIWRDVGGLYFTHSSAAEQKTLRVAMLTPPFHVITGIRVHQLLRPKMTPESWIELQDCLDLSPDAIVEFSVYARNVGDRVNRNTIIWEVREY